jgi:membrane protease YdiL (CAAX protease family)
MAPPGIYAKLRDTEKWRLPLPELVVDSDKDERGGSVQTEQTEPETNSCNEYVATLLASFLPGAGYAYVGEYGKAALTAPLLVPREVDNFYRPPTHNRYAALTGVRYLAQNTHQLTVYDTRQDCLDRSGMRENEVMSLRRFSLSELLLTPYNPDTYIGIKDSGGKFAFFLDNIGLFLALTILGGKALRLSEGIHPSVRWEEAAYMIPYALLVYTFVAAGEEAENRLTYGPMFANLTGNKWVGNALQAVRFGLVHTSYGKYASLYMADEIFEEYRTVEPYGTPVANPGMGDLVIFGGTAIMGFAYGALVNLDPEWGPRGVVLAHMLSNFSTFFVRYLIDGDDSDLPVFKIGGSF